MNDDEACAAGWRSGDLSAGERLIERHYDAITRFFATKAGAEADDLVQLTFLRASESLGVYRGDGSFRAYLFGIARNVLFEHIRRRVRGGLDPVDVGASSIADLGPGVATGAAVRAEQRTLVSALQRVPIDLQILLELYFWEELSVGELAALLEVPAGTIKSRLHRARSLLRDAMAQVPASLDDRESARNVLDAWARSVRERLPDGDGA